MNEYLLAGIAAGYILGAFSGFLSKRLWIPPKFKQHQCTAFIQLPSRKAKMCCDCLQVTPTNSIKIEHQR